MINRINTYRETEQRFWLHNVGSLPTEHYVELPTLNTRVRLLEYGQGPMLLFVHGGPNAASTWAPLVNLLSDFRCVLLERPGCGLSSPSPAQPRNVRPYVVQVIQDALTVLDCDPEAVIASSFGSYCALAYAVAHPSRIKRMVHMGCPALVPGSRLPLPFLFPLIPLVGSLVQQLEPPTLATSQRSFRRMGHTLSFAEANSTRSFLEWYTELTRDTPTRANDQALFARIRLRDALSTAELADLPMPMSFFWGEADTFGGAAVAQRLVTTVPRATLEILPRGGHLPWLDAPERAAEHVRSYLAA